METTDNSTQETTTPSVETSTDTSTETKVFDTQAQPEGTSWMWGDDIAGQGDKPDWFKDSKYKSVSEQAKAYGELEKKLGGFIGAPKEGYVLNEDVGVQSDDPAIKAVFDILGKNNASNEFANELIAAYSKTQQEQSQAYLQKEMELLGENKEYRLKAISEFANSALPENMRDAFSNMITSASSVEVIEALMKKSLGSSVAPDVTKTQSAKVDKSSLQAMMMATNEHGQLKASIDPEYKKKVDQAYREFYGE